MRRQVKAEVFNVVFSDVGKYEKRRTPPIKMRRQVKAEVFNVVFSDGYKYEKEPPPIKMAR